MSEQQSEKTPTHRIMDDALGGDGVEKLLWPHLSSVFPQYEMFWSEYVWPLTNRLYHGRLGVKDFHFRGEISGRQANLELVAQAHYESFVTAGSIYLRSFKWPFSKIDSDDADGDLKKTLHDDRFLDIYRLYGTLMDHLGGLASAVERLLIAAQLKAWPEEKPADIEGRFKTWLGSKKYSDALARYRSSGASTVFVVHHRDDALRRLISADLLSDLSALKGETDSYRNLLHKPVPAQMFSGGEHLVPLPKFVEKYERWSKMATATPEEREKEFWPLETALKSHFDRLMPVLGRVWDDLMVHMALLAATSSYRQWLAAVPESDFKLPAHWEHVTTSTSSAAFPFPSSFFPGPKKGS